jgi:hypothetical protein
MVLIRVRCPYCHSDDVNELPRSKLRGIKPPLAYTRVPPVWRGDIRVACAP